MSIAENLNRIKNSLPEKVTLVAVSKTKPSSDILEAYSTGHRDFGENKVQEMVSKWEELPRDIRWHMIGHLQRNKVKYMAEFVHLIHAVDSLRLLAEIDKQGKRYRRVIDCLLQLRIAREETKFGLEEQEIRDILEGDPFRQMKHVRVVGLMGMATFTEDSSQLSHEFAALERLYTELAPEYGFHTLSMGMSGDYPLALEHGSNMVRVGSSIFGARNYTTKN
jgi:pyridoxal phosphate enzyme (YggS family)